MKKIIIIQILTMALMLGCSPKQEPEDTPPPPEMPAAHQESAGEIVENYGKGLAGSLDKAHAAQAKVDIREVQRAIQDYTSTNGNFPVSLDDLAGYVSPNLDLSAFYYDPETGQVNIKM